MRTTLALIALAAAASFTPAMAQVPGPRPTQPGIYQPALGPQLSAPDVIRALEQQGYRDFRKIERENGLYEVTATRADGRVFKLYVDGATGHVLGQQERFPRLDDDD